MRLLLISNSTAHGSGYLDHCADAIAAFLATPVASVLFVPYALSDHDGYAARARDRFGRMGLRLDSVHDAPGDLRQAVNRAEALFIGGGNTFRLLDALWRHGLIESVSARVREGMPYVGASAGSNVACPSIKTTNDMPIIEPPSFRALGLVPFNINPHYQDPIPGSTHMGESREQRIAEFHEANDVPVVGLRENAWLLVEGPSIAVHGAAAARVFVKGKPPAEYPAGSRLDFLLP